MRFSIIKREPSYFFENIHEDLNRFLKDTFGDMEQIDNQQSPIYRAFRPAVEIKEKMDKYEVKVELPNVQKEDIEVELNEDYISIEAESKFEECKEEEFDSPLGDGSGAGVIFGNTGGVTEAAFRTAYYYITGKDLKDDKLVFSEVRGMNGIKNIEVNIDGINIKGAVVNGIKNLKKALDIIKEDSSSYQFIEVMNCNGGCIAGGGQPKTTLLNMLKTKEARIGGLYSTDEKMVKRVSYKNPEIKKIYEEFFKEPNSDIAHKYLHTTSAKSGLHDNCAKLSDSKYVFTKQSKLSKFSGVFKYCVAVCHNEKLSLEKSPKLN